MGGLGSLAAVDAAGLETYATTIAAKAGGLGGVSEAWGGGGDADADDEDGGVVAEDMSETQLAAAVQAFRKHLESLPKEEIVFVRKM